MEMSSPCALCEEEKILRKTVNRTFLRRKKHEQTYKCKEMNLLDIKWEQMQETEAEIWLVC